MKVSLPQLLLVVILAGTSYAREVSSQSLLDKTITIHVEQADIRTFIRKLKEVSGVDIVYSSKAIAAHRKVTVHQEGKKLSSVLESVLGPLEISYKEVNGVILLQRQEPESFHPGTGDRQENLPPPVTDQNITGKVTDDKGEPLPGVSILIKNSTQGTVTDVKGEYNINIPNSSAILVFSYVGFLTAEEAVGTRSRIDLKLMPDVAALEEVVVIGYGEQRKSDLTGSVSVLTSDHLTTVPTPNFEMGIQGKVPGVQMTNTSAEPGGGVSVKIRGTTSLLGNNEPLYVIDGFPFENNNTTRPGSFNGQRPLNLLANLNPGDIESVQILKDASATAIYGTRGANGVIIITTKRGKEGKAKVDFSYSHAFSKPNKTIKLANVYDYARIENEYITNLNRTDYRFTTEPNAYGLKNVSPEELRQQYGEGTDWFEQIFQTGHASIYDLSVSGGNDRITYNISGNYYDQSGIIIGTGFKRGSVRSNISAKLSSKATLSVNLNQSVSSSQRTFETSRNLAGAPESIGLVLEAYRASPITLPLQAFERNDLTQFDPGIGNANHFTYDPVRTKTYSENGTKTDFFIGTMNFDYNLWDDLKVTFRAGANFQNEDSFYFFPRNTSRGAWTNGNASKNTYSSKDYLFENFLTYSKNLAGKHSINLMAGYSYQRINSETFGITATNFDNTILGLHGWNQLVTPIAPTSRVVNRVLLSQFFRGFYSYNNRYLLTLTVRRDGSSVFSENNKWAVFPSAALAWNVTEESFMPETGWLSNLKIRTSYGITGNQAIAPYQSMARLGSQAYVYGSVRATGFRPTAASNSDLLWETSRQFNLGADIGLLHDRISLNVDYYTRYTTDLLQARPVPGSTGFSSFTSNFGEISNKGLELGIDARILTGTFSWSSTANWSFNRNKIVDLGRSSSGEIIENAASPNILTRPAESHRFILGQPVGTFFGFSLAGVLQEADIQAGCRLVNPGDMKYVDRNNDGAITDADRGILGNAQPDFIYGWDNTFSYKNFSLNVFVTGVKGGKVLNMARIYTVSGGMRTDGGRPSQDYVDNYWRPDRTDGKYPRPGGGMGNDTDISNFLIEDGSFMRIRNLRLSYLVPADRLKTKLFREATLYVMGNDLFTFTKYSGFDPEVSFGGQNDAAPNVDQGAYPRAKTVTLGVKLGF